MRVPSGSTLIARFISFPFAVLLAVPAFAQTVPDSKGRAPVAASAEEAQAPAPFVEPTPITPTKAKPDPDMFIGMRGGVAVPVGASLIAPTMGVEMGIARETGFGFGLHLLGAFNTPAVGPFTAMPLAFGVAADLRLYIQATRLVTFYPSLSAGFLLGQNTKPLGEKSNAMLPLLNPAFGTRVRLPANMYGALEFGMASFFIPFIGVSIGYLPT